MKSKTLVAFAVAIASALCSPGARAGDGYQLKTKIFIFKAADLPTATVSAGVATSSATTPRKPSDNGVIGNRCSMSSVPRSNR